jgi:hypothetical protein
VLIWIPTNNNVRLIYFVRVLLCVGCNVTYSKIEMPKKHVDYTMSLVSLFSMMVMILSSFFLFWIYGVYVGDEEHVRKQEKKNKEESNIWKYVSSWNNNNYRCR